MQMNDLISKFNALRSLVGQKRSQPTRPRFTYAEANGNGYWLSLMGYDFQKSDLPKMREEFRKYLEAQGIDTKAIKDEIDKLNHSWEFAVAWQGKEFFSSLPHWKAALDLAPGSIGLKLFENYKQVRKHHLPGQHVQDTHGSWAEGRPPPTLDPLEGTRAPDRGIPRKERAPEDFHSGPFHISEGSPGSLTPEEMKDRNKVIHFLEDLGRDWMDHRTGGDPPTRQDLSDLGRYLGEKYGQYVDVLVKDFDDYQKYPERPAVHLVIGEKNVPDVWLLGWRESRLGLEATPIHDHGQSEAGIYVHKGAVNERIFAIDKKEFGKNTIEFREVDRGLDAKSAVSINAPYLHDIGAQKGAGTSVTIHSYYPPLNDMGFYEVQGSKLVKSGTWKEDPDVMKAKGFAERSHIFPCFHYSTKKYHDPGVTTHIAEMPEKVERIFHQPGLHDQERHGDWAGQSGPQVERYVADVARMMGAGHLLSSVVVKPDELGPEFKVAGQTRNAAAHFDPDTGKVVLFKGSFDPTNSDSISDILAHEFTHLRFHDLQDQREIENQLILNQSQRFLKDGPTPYDPRIPIEIAEADRDPVWNNHKDDPLKPNGELKPEYYGRYPAVALWDLHIGNEWDALYESDGVTEYSRKWWDHAKNWGGSPVAAINETLAEIAMLDLRRKTLADNEYYKVHKAWRRLYSEFRDYAQGAEGVSKRTKFALGEAPVVFYFDRKLNLTSADKAAIAKVYHSDGSHDWIFIDGVKTFHQPGLHDQERHGDWAEGQGQGNTITGGGPGAGSAPSTDQPNLAIKKKAKLSGDYHSAADVLGIEPEDFADGFAVNLEDFDTDLEISADYGRPDENAIREDLIEQARGQIDRDQIIQELYDQYYPDAVDEAREELEDDVKREIRSADKLPPDPDNEYQTANILKAAGLDENDSESAKTEAIDEFIKDHIDEDQLNDRAHEIADSKLTDEIDDEIQRRIDQYVDDNLQDAIDAYEGDSPETVKVEGHIKDRYGNRVGDFEREINYDEGSVYHAAFFIDDRYQDKHIARELLDSSFKFYDKIGLRKVTVLANGQVGTYAWAVYGFDFDSQYTLQSKRDGLLQHIKDRHRDYYNKLDPEKRAELDTRVKSLKHSWEIAMFRLGDVKVGKDFMIQSNSWHGTLDLKGEGRRIFDAYVRASRSKVAEDKNQLKLPFAQKEEDQDEKAKKKEQRQHWQDQDSEAVHRDILDMEDEMFRIIGGHVRDGLKQKADARARWIPKSGKISAKKPDKSKPNPKNVEKEFHLPGQHDQADHGRWARGIRKEPPPPPQASPGGQYPLPGMAQQAQEVVTNPARYMEKTALSSGTVTNESPLGGGANETELVDIESPNGHYTAVFKPVDGERADLRAHIPGDYYLREAAASDLAEVLELDDFVPTTTVREINGRLGSVQGYRNNDLHSAFDADDPFEYLRRDFIGRVAAFDYLIGNQDRHYGNWLVSDSGRVVLIDHGLSLPEQNNWGIRSSFTQRAYDENISIQDAIGGRWDSKWPLIEKTLKDRGFNARVLRATKQRFDDLIFNKNQGNDFSSLSLHIFE